MTTRTFAPITLEQLKAYARASGDHNPIHQDEAVARAAGLPGVIAHGMLIAGFLADVAREALGDSKPMTGFKVRFRAMTFLGDVITVSAQASPGGSGALQVEAKNQRGEVVATAQAQPGRVV